MSEAAVPSLHVAWVCTANVCRSVYAETELTRKADLAHLDGVHCASAGVRARPGQAMDPVVRTRLTALGNSLEHAAGSQALTSGLLTTSDITLVMTREHARFAEDLVPSARRRIVLARDLLDLLRTDDYQVRGGASPRRVKRRWEALALQASRGQGHDVADPYRRSEADYEVMFATIDELTERMVALESRARRQPA